MKKDLILILGASGMVGSELARQLKKEGYQARLTTSRNPTGSDQVQVNLVTGEGVAQAFQGVDKAFLLSPPGYSDQYKLLSPLIQEAKRQGLKKVVLMTAMGANAIETSPFRKAEIELEKSGLSYNIIRPNWFFQNFHTFWLQGILEQKKILLPAGQAKVSFIDARDISSVAARLLTSDQFSNQAFDLSGPEAIDHQEVAKALSEIVGQKVTYQEISPEILKQGLISAGLPVDYVDFMLMIFGFLREGYNARTTDHVKMILGREAMGLKNYTKDHKQKFLGA